MIQPVDHVLLRLDVGAEELVDGVNVGRDGDYLDAIIDVLHNISHVSWYV